MAANEDAAGEFDSDGWCLLHYAVWYKAPAPVVKAVFAANPEATEEKDKDGDTPLELGVKYSAAAGGVAVLRQYSTAAEVCRSYLLEGRSLDTAAFATWLDSNPSAAKDRNEDDENTALHYSMKIKGVPVGAVAALVAAWKGAAKRLDGGGRTPLHLALRHRAPVDVVKVVLSAWPKAMTVLDDDGNNPLHLGLLNKAPAVSACTGRRKAMVDTVVPSRARVGACVYVRACMCVYVCAPARQHLREYVLWRHCPYHAGIPSYCKLNIPSYCTIALVCFAYKTTIHIPCAYHRPPYCSCWKHGRKATRCEIEQKGRHYRSEPCTTLHRKPSQHSGACAPRLKSANLG